MARLLLGSAQVHTGRECAEAVIQGFQKVLEQGGVPSRLGILGHGNAQDQVRADRHLYRLQYIAHSTRVLPTRVAGNGLVKASLRHIGEHLA